MIEMLMAAFILAIGILGLAMLQTYTFRVQGGSASQGKAIYIGQDMLEQAEIIGRNSIILSRAGTKPPVPTSNPFGTTSVVQTYNYSGQPITSGTAYFTGTSTATTTVATSNPGVVAPIKGLGGIAIVTVVVTWSEATNASKTAINRSVTLTRRIGYATA